MSRQRFWIGVVSKEHVERGKQSGFAQVCHGKQAPLSRMKPRDILVYYSPQLRLGEKNPYQCFTAFSVVQEGAPYQVEMAPDFKPFRRKVVYLPAKDALIKPLISSFSFIQNKEKWGYMLRYGFFEIPLEDIRVIAYAMEIPSDYMAKIFI
jgi:hypothetical protein